MQPRAAGAAPRVCRLVLRALRLGYATSCYMKSTRAPPVCFYSICTMSMIANFHHPTPDSMVERLGICCKSKQVELLSISCRHAALCESCGLSAIICPICEEIIKGTIKIYLDFTLQLSQFL